MWWLLEERWWAEGRPQKERASGRPTGLAGSSLLLRSALVGGKLGYQSFPSVRPSWGSTARPQVGWEMAGLTDLALPSPRPTRMPPVLKPCKRVGSHPPAATVSLFDGASCGRGMKLQG